MYYNLSPEVALEELRKLAESKPDHFEVGFQLGSAAVREATPDQMRSPLALIMDKVNSVRATDADVENLHTTPGFILGAVSAALLPPATK
jgi:hypothetical protein